jgi:hypothetical protein
MERDNLENIDVDTTIITKWILKVIVWEDMPAAYRQFKIGYRGCEHGNRTGL